MKTDYYTVLDLDRNCRSDDIKRAYRRLALSNHPDKASLNGLSDEEATQKFQELQEAYSVLSDPRQRSWYDDHREQILCGDEAKENQDPLADLCKYNTTRCYRDFGDGEGGFYSVYSKLFTSICKAEREKSGDSDSESPCSDFPSFGNSESAWEGVSAFYRSWTDFSSRQSFNQADRWNPNMADSRQMRRTMEAQNKKAKAEARKVFNTKVREIVRFVKDRDPRVVEHRKVQLEDEALKKAAKADLQKRELEEKKRDAEQRKRKLAPVAKLAGCR
jgi:DnaJ family protein A protein 5